MRQLRRLRPATSLRRLPGSASPGELPARDSPACRPQPTTRRLFLRRAGTVAGAIGIVGAPAVATTAVASEQGVLTSRRRSIYTALVEAVGSVPGTLVDASRSEQAARALASHYRQASPHTREEIDSTLDAIEEGRAVGSFSRSRVAERLALLRADLDSDDARRTEAAVALAAAPFQGGGFRWDPRSATLWVRVVRSLSSAAA